MSARRRILPLFIPHLGCSHSCVFCNQKRISGAAEPVTPREVAAALERLPTAAGYELAFYGGSFTALPRDEMTALLKAAQPYRADGRIASIRVSTRPDAVDEQVLSVLAEAGVETVELGAQSMCDEVLASCGRGHTAEQTRTAASLLRQRGFYLILQMMTGLPGSSPARDLATAHALAQLRPDGVRIYPTVILKDTELYALWQRGDYREHTVADAVELCAEILPVFEAAKIPVIRLGLNPTEDLSGGDAAAGAYHPALGELVRSRIYLKRARALLADSPQGKSVVLGVCPGDISQMIGQHRCNADALCREFSLRSLKVVPADVPRGEVIEI